MNAPPDGFRYGSVCSGIEAVAVAWRPLGLAPAWLSEVDPFANAVLAHHYPDVPNLGDMTRLAHAVLDRAVYAPDILVGGTPCQSFSIAGERHGLADPRGALTLKYVELANAIDQIRVANQKPASVLVWENVPGVLSDRSNAFGCFLGAIAGEGRALRPAGTRWTHAGCVYGPQRTIAWRVLDAQFFGLAQRRKRVFVVASARHDFDPAAVLFESESVRRDTSPRTQARQGAAAPASERAAHSCGAHRGVGDLGPEEGQCSCFGGGKSSGSIPCAACLTARGHKDDLEVETFAVQALSGEVSHPLTRAHDVTEDGNGRGVPIISMSYRLNEAPALAFAQNSRGEVRLEGGNGHLIGALSSGGGKPGQGLPTIVSVALPGREGGVSAELSEQASALRASSGGSDKAHVLAPSFEAHLQCELIASGHGAVSPSDARWRVRRLMPIECERLQGLPDDYTLVPYRGGWAADGPRYKAIGNSMAVTCVAWIGRRLIRVLRARL